MVAQLPVGWEEYIESRLTRASKKIRDREATQSYGVDKERYTDMTNTKRQLLQRQACEDSRSRNRQGERCGTEGDVWCASVLVENDG